jgi:hypothetical protein
MQRVIIPTALRVEIGRHLLAGGVSGRNVSMTLKHLLS